VVTLGVLEQFPQEEPEGIATHEGVQRVLVKRGRILWEEDPGVVAVGEDGKAPLGEHGLDFARAGFLTQGRNLLPQLLEAALEITQFLFQLVHAVHPGRSRK
jgi:hypothetical protein